jgi:aryl-alcohol dehydrogenase-like predicted oxidoreductase
MIAERLALGTVQFGLDYGIANTNGIVSEKEMIAILDLAKKRGIDTLDTAIAYGSSEERLGLSGINGWSVITKLSSIPPGTGSVETEIRESVRNSLQRLRIEKLYGLLLHVPGQLLNIQGEQIYRTLSELKEEGIVSKIGYSVYEPGELDLLVNSFPPDIVQIPLNVLDRRFISTGWLRQLKESGVEIHTRSAFLQGLLLMIPGERPQKFNHWNDLWQRWDFFVRQSGLTAAQICLGFACSIQEVNKIVIGVDSVAHLNDILDTPPVMPVSVPDTLSCEDIRLINPSNWKNL